MFKRQLTVNIKDLDLKIGKLNKELETMEDDEKYEMTLVKLTELIDLRCKLSESKDNGSVKAVVISGLFGMASLIAVLKYEEKDVITSKAFSMATSMFRGSK